MARVSPFWMMLVRLGRVVYWLGCTLAGLGSAAAVFNVLRWLSDEDGSSRASLAAVLCGAFALVAFCLGYGARRVFSR